MNIIDKNTENKITNFNALEFSIDEISTYSDYNEREIVATEQGITEWDKICSLLLNSPWMCLLKKNITDLKNFSTQNWITKEYVSSLFRDFTQLQYSLSSQAEYKNVKYIIWLSHLAKKLKKFWFHIYDIDQNNKERLWEDYFKGVVLKKIEYTARSILYSFLSQIPIISESKKNVFLIQNKMYKQQLFDIIAVNKYYKLNDTKLVIISVKDFLSIDFS